MAKLSAEEVQALRRALHRKGHMIHEGLLHFRLWRRGMVRGGVVTPAGIQALHSHYHGTSIKL